MRNKYIPQHDCAEWSFPAVRPALHRASASIEPLTLVGLGGLAAGLGGLGGYFGSQEKQYAKTGTLHPRFQLPIAGQLRDYLMARMAKGIPYYQYNQGRAMGAMSPWEQQGLDTLGQYTSGMGQYMPQRQAAYAKALGGEALAPIDMGASREWFEQNVMPQYQGRFQEMAAPATEQARAMMGGKSSSAMNRALSETAGGMSRYLGDIGYEFMRSEEQAKREREQFNVMSQQQAMQMTEPQRQEWMNNIQASMQYGAIPREVDTQNFLMNYQQYAQLVDQMINYLNISMQAIVPSTGPITGAAAGAGGMLGGMGSLFGGIGKMQ